MKLEFSKMCCTSCLMLMDKSVLNVVKLSSESEVDYALKKRWQDSKCKTMNILAFCSVTVLFHLTKLN